MTPIAAGRMIHLVLSTQSVDHLDDHNGKPSAQYELDRSLPSQARDLETKHLKSPQCIQSNWPHQAPTLVAPRTWQDMRCTQPHHPGPMDSVSTTSPRKALEAIYLDRNLLSGPLFTLSSTAPKVESTGANINPVTNHNHKQLLVVASSGRCSCCTTGLTR